MYIALHNRLVAAVELVSPRNKDRPSSRAVYLARYLGYLLEGVHLLLVDVHPYPLQFSFADALAQELRQGERPRFLPPLAISYQVRGAAPEGGRMLGVWRRPLAVGAPLPPLPLPLSARDDGIMVALEPTYQRAAADAYLT